MKLIARIMLPLAICVLVLSLAFTIVGSSTNLDALLAAGIAGWLAASALLFVSIVLIVWTRTGRSGKVRSGA